MQLRTIECDPYGYVFFQQSLSHRGDSTVIADWKGRNANKPFSICGMLKGKPSNSLMFSVLFCLPTCDSGSTDFTREDDSS